MVYTPNVRERGRLEVLLESVYNVLLFVASYFLCAIVFGLLGFEVFPFCPL